MTISDTRLKKKCKSEDIAEGVEVHRGLARAALPAEAALRSACLFHYLAGGLRLFGAGEFW